MGCTSSHIWLHLQVHHVSSLWIWLFRQTMTAHWTHLFHQTMTTRWTQLFRQTVTTCWTQLFCQTRATQLFHQTQSSLQMSTTISFHLYNLLCLILTYWSRWMLLHQFVILLTIAYQRSMSLELLQVPLIPQGGSFQNFSSCTITSCESPAI